MHCTLDCKCIIIYRVKLHGSYKVKATSGSNKYKFIRL